MTERCAACSCEISADVAAGAPGSGLRHGQKWYCMECAGMILPPEELERLSKSWSAETSAVAIPPPPPAPPPPAPTAPTSRARPPSSVLASDDDVLGEEVPDSDPPADSAPPAPVSRAVSPSRRETATVSGRRTPSTRSQTSVAPSASATRRAASSRRDSTGPGSRGDRADPAPSRGDGRTRNRAADSMGLYIGLGVGAVALMVVLYLVFGRTPERTVVKPTKVKEPVFVDNDKTPSWEYEKKAEELQAKKEWQAARNYYNKAIDRAIAEKNEDKAKILQMKLESMSKSSTLK